MPPWDGVDRFTLYQDEILRMENPQPWHASMTRHFFTGLVARMEDPGTKVDSIKVYAGIQGAGKSKAFRLIIDGHLRGSQWFTDAPISLTHKDGRMLIGTNLLVEWSEAEHAKSPKKIDTVKQFLSQQEDEFRPPYGRNMVKRPRRCVFCATSNDLELLRDRTGSRRFYIFKVGKKIDLQKLTQWRPQLFAQALAVYRRHKTSEALSEAWHETRWWFTAEEEEERERINTLFHARSAWHDDIQAWVEERAASPQPNFTIGEVIEGGLKVPRAQKSKSTEVEVRATLQLLGCVKPKQRSRNPDPVTGKSKQAWWWSPPPEMTLS